MLGFVHIPIYNGATRTTIVNVASDHVTGLCRQVSLLFEVQDLDEASPATVSRAGMVYTDYKAIGWRPYVNSWLQTVQCKQTAEEVRSAPWWTLVPSGRW